MNNKNIEDDNYSLYKNAWVFRNAPHLSLELSQRETNSLLKKGGMMVRNTYNFDSISSTSFWYIIKDSFKGMAELSSKVRNQVKKSLKIYDVKKVSKDELIRVGFPIFEKAMEGYNVKSRVITKQRFIDSISNITNDRRLDYWIAYEKQTGRAVAYAVNTISDESCQYNVLKAIPQYLKNSSYPYYGLIFEMNRYYLEDEGLKYVTDGSRTVTEHSNIQNFLVEKFNFRKAYCNLQMEYVWWLKLLVFMLFRLRKFITIQPLKATLNMEAMKRNLY